MSRDELLQNANPTTIVGAVIMLLIGWVGATLWSGYGMDKELAKDVQYMRESIQKIEEQLGAAAVDRWRVSDHQRFAEQQAERDVQQDKAIQKQDERMDKIFERLMQIESILRRESSI